MAKHKKHDPQDLEEALEHVAYEIWKYRQSVAFYPRILRVGGDAAIEFRVLHHRVLLEFFYGPPKHENNIVAWEYVDEWHETHDRNSQPWLSAYMTRCHTMLAHISTTRTEMAKRGLKDWDVEWGTVEPHLDQLILEFLEGLSKKHKNICLRWVNKWLRGRHPGNIVLDDIAACLKTR